MLLTLLRNRLFMLVSVQLDSPSAVAKAHYQREDAPMPTIVGENIDRLATVEMRPAVGNLPRGAMNQLYDAVREKYGEPLVSRAVAAIARRVSPGDNVVILTGAGGPPHLPHSEVDGIPGAIAIARALHYGYGASVTILTEDRAEAPVRATARAAAMNIRRTEENPELAHCIVYEPSPIEREDCARHAEDIINRLDPAVMIAIEKLSPNTAGVIHGITGLSYDAVHTKADEYFRRAAERGILTFGIGDGGNEIGFGVANEAAKDIMPAGRSCLCECGAGTAAAVSTDEFMVAAISDWGGYAFGAMVAYATGIRRAMLSPRDVERMLTACVDAGAMDGVRATPEIGDDGVPLDAHLAYMSLLNTLVDIAASPLDSPGH